MTRETGARYECSSGLSAGCDKGDGKPGRSRCRACRAPLTVYAGMFGVFVWRGDAQYPADAALSLHASAVIAQRKADADVGTVVRWVPRQQS